MDHPVEAEHSVATEPLVLVERHSPIAILILNEPAKRNPLSPGLVAGAIDALESLATEDDITVVIVTGAGPVFQSGADLRRMRTASPLEDRFDYEGILKLHRLMWEYPKPTIAAVHGYAQGGGLMSWCDLVIAEEGTRMACPEVNVGIPSATIIPTLSRIIGRRRMFELVLTGDTIDASEAERIGLINHVAPKGETLVMAKSLASRIAEHHLDALRLTKEVTRVTLDMAYREALEYARDVRVIGRLRRDFRVEVPQGAENGMDAKDTAAVGGE